MRVNQKVACQDFPCQGVDHGGYLVPNIDINADSVRLVLISEAAPASAADYYYAGDQALFAQTTVQAFNDAGIQVSSIDDLLARGVYLTTAVKCAKIGYGLKAGPIRACSLLLEQELALFPNVQAWLLMGDVAIKTVNDIASRAGQGRVIPAGSTYKIRGGDFSFRGKPAFPSYVQAGPAFFVEKSKRHMIAEDIAAAWNLLV